MSNKVARALAAALGVAVIVLVVALVDARGRIAALEQEASRAPPRVPGAGQDVRLAAMELRLARLEAAPVAARLPAAAAALPAAPSSTSMPTPPPAVAWTSPAGSFPVADLPLEIRQKIERQATRSKEENDTEREDEALIEVGTRADALADEAKLTPAQAAQVRAMLRTEWFDVRQAFRDRLARGEQLFPGVKQDVRALRARTDENVVVVIDDAQRAVYERMRARDGKGWADDGG